MYLYGASGHAKVIIDILNKRGIIIEGVYDDDSSKVRLLDMSVLHVTQEIESIDGQFIISIGNNRIRKNVSQFHSLGYSTVTHPTSNIDENVICGYGTVAMASSVVNASSIIGNHVIINTAAVVEHDCSIGDFTHISPKACLCGGVVLGEGTHIGAGAVVLPGVTIGKWCIIGAGTVVLNDIPSYSVAVGNPSRIIRMVEE